MPNLNILHAGVAAGDEDQYNTPPEEIVYALHDAVITMALERYLHVDIEEHFMIATIQAMDVPSVEGDMLCQEFRAEVLFENGEEQQESVLFFKVALGDASGTIRIKTTLEDMNVADAFRHMPPVNHHVH